MKIAEEQVLVKIVEPHNHGNTFGRPGTVLGRAVGHDDEPLEIKRANTRSFIEACRSGDVDSSA